MPGYILALLVILLTAAYDAKFTASKLAIYGEHIELNPTIRRLVRRYGPRLGTWLGVGIPTAVIAVIGWWIPFLAVFVAGARTTLCAFQVLESSRPQARNPNEGPRE